MGKRKRLSISEILRRCLREARSLRGVSDATGLNVGTLSMFVRGKSSLRLDKADLLAAHFGVVCRRSRRKGAVAHA